MCYLIMREELIKVRKQVKEKQNIKVDLLEDLFQSYPKNTLVGKMGRKLIKKSIFRKDCIDTDEDREILLIYLNYLLTLIDY